jgi:S-formylglutathione hydrolase FrmB
MHKFSLLLLAVAAAVVCRAAKVEEKEIPSTAMNKSIKALVVYPDAYAKGDRRYPVVYMLHGHGDNQTGWVQKGGVAPLADQHGVIIVCPDAGISWYYDSPVNPALRYETFVAKELVAWTDANYRTIAERKARAIMGLSMGGHGALYLGSRHTDTFAVAAVMSGGVDVRPFAKQWELENKLGSPKEHPENWDNGAAITNALKLKNGELAISIDCGTGDFFLQVNRNLHTELQKAKIDHDYTERPGVHSWVYWSNSVKYQYLFFHEFLAKQGIGSDGMPATPATAATAH